MGVEYKMPEELPELSKILIENFYRGRALKFDPKIPEVSMLLQDRNPNLALERSAFEIQKIYSYIVSSEALRVLDVGCGIGRWGVALKSEIKSYLGTDFCEPLLAIAKQQLSEVPDCIFEKLEAHDARHTEIGIESDVIIFSGVAQYLSNKELSFALTNFITILKRSKGTLYFRCSISNSETFSLVNHWSEELETHYSAKYRSVSELELYFEQAGYYECAKIFSSGKLYPAHLQNRKETQQWYWVWKFN